MFAVGNTVKTNLWWQRDGLDGFCPRLWVYKSEEISLRVISEHLCGHSQICQVLLKKTALSCSDETVQTHPPSLLKEPRSSGGSGECVSATVQQFVFHTPMQTVWVCTFRKWGCPRGRKRGLSELTLWTALGCYSCHFYLRPTWAHVLYTTAEALGVAKNQQLLTIYLQMSPNQSYSLNFEHWTPLECQMLFT